MLVTSTRDRLLLQERCHGLQGQPCRDGHSGNINLTKAFTLKTSGALVNGKPIKPHRTANQGFFYHESKKVLYYPLTKDNVSVVLVYRNVSATSTGVLSPSADTSFRITSAKYNKFEIEGVGVNSKDGKLYFSTNRSTTTNGNVDGVHVFERYVA